MDNNDVMKVARQMAKNSFRSGFDLDEEMELRGWYYIDKVKSTLKALKALGYRKIS